MKIVTQLTDWPTSLHRASINSFGYGGANAHAILDSVENVLPGYTGSRSQLSRGDPTKLYILPFSGSTTQSLEARILELSKRFSLGETYDFGDLCHTLADRRSKLGRKGFLITSAATAKSDFSLNKLVTPRKVIPKLDIGFIFTGQGAQWPQMGKELIEQYPLFSQTIDHLDSVLQALPEAPAWSIRSALLEPAATSKVGDASFSQPLCTAVQVGIVKLLQSWNVVPSVVAGHSSGEIGAAYSAGLLTETHAIIIAFYRGFVVRKTTKKGCMLAVGMSADDAEAKIDELSLRDEICTACVNSPESTTISGNTTGIDTFAKELNSKGIFARKLATGGRAYHSFLMKEVGEEYESLVSKAILGLPTDNSHRNGKYASRFFSSVSNSSDALASFSRETNDFLRPAYWRANLESPVQFSTAMKNIMATGDYHLLEIGPHGALQLPIKQVRAFLGLSEDALPYNSTLTRGKDADICMKTLAGELYLSGHEIDFLEVNNIHFDGDKNNVGVITDLPPYQWSYTQLLWNEPRSSIDLRNRNYVRHELLGSETAAANGIERCWRNLFKPSEVPWIDDHRVSKAHINLGAFTNTNRQ